MTSPLAFELCDSKRTLVGSMEALFFMTFNSVQKKYFSAAVGVVLAWVSNLPPQVFNGFTHNTRDCVTALRTATGCGTARAADVVSVVTHLNESRRLQILDTGRAQQFWKQFHRQDVHLSLSQVHLRGKCKVLGTRLSFGTCNVSQAIFII
jgi:hypothetical protein